MIEDIQITNLGAGELSPRLLGRTDEEKYYDGAQVMLNMVPMPQGGCTRRPGTMFIALTDDQSNPCRLIDFQFSVQQAYILEFFGGGARVYADDGQVLSGGAPVRISLPYASADLAALGYCQSDDELFLTHYNYPPMSINRTSNTAWTTSTLTFLDGPYLDVNTTPTTLTPSEPNGTITVTASSAAGINGGAGFQISDVGRLLRMQLSGLWAWMVINTVASPTSITAVVMPSVNNGAYGALDGAQWTANTYYPTYVIVSNAGHFYQATTGGTSGSGSAPTGTSTTGIYDGTVIWKYVTNVIFSTTTWALGKWVNGVNPAHCSFWQNRFCLGGTSYQPNCLELSVTGDFFNFAPTQADGTVSDVNALSWVFDNDQVNEIRWLSPVGSAQAMQFGIGTVGGEEIVQAAATAQALTPTSVQAYQETQLGSAANVRVHRIGKSTLFVNRNGRKLHEWTFEWQLNGYAGPDLAVLAEHITRGVDGSGIVQTAYQQNPHGILWAIRGDGGLIGMTYLREQNIVAWHRHQLGGDYYGGPPKVETITCIPSPDGTYDELWMQVLRTINGTPTRTVEVMTRFFENLPLEKAWFSDCALQTVLPTPAASITFSGFVNGASALKPPAFSGFGSLAASAAVFSYASVNQLVRANGGLLLITGFANAQLVEAQVILPMYNLAPAAQGTWTMAAKSTTLSGLGYLNGETVAIIGDGFDLGTAVVSGGSITIPSPGGSLVTAGLPVTPVLVTMPFEPARAAAASTQGRLKRVDTMWVRFYETVGASFGVRQVDPVTFNVTDKTHYVLTRTGANLMDQPTPLLTGIRELRPPSGYDRELQMLFTAPPVLPMTILSVHARAGVAT